MRAFRAVDEVRPAPGLQVVELEPDVVMIRSAAGSRVLRGWPLAAIESLLAAIGTSTTVGRLDAPGAQPPQDPELLRELVGVAVQVCPPSRTTAARPASAVVLLSNGELGARLHQELATARAVKLVRLPPGAPGIDEQLSGDLRRAARIIACLEDVDYAALFQIADAAVSAEVPCTFVTVTGGRLEVGPTLVASNRRALELSRFTAHGLSAAASDRLGLFRAGRLDAAVADRALSRAGQRLLQDLSLAVSDLCWKTLECEGDRAVERRLAQPASFDWLAAGGHSIEGGRLDAAISLEPEVVTTGVPPARLSAPETSRQVKSVGIIGGGTAGYFAAIALKRQLPELDVTVIESSKIPIIGVGEATTPALPRFLHGMAGVDPADLYKMGASWKLGIRFEWGLPAPYHFNFPFGAGDLLSSLAHDGTTTSQNLNSLLMEADTSPLVRLPDGRHYSLLPRMMYAYHLDNAPFVGFLNRHALSCGVKHLDRTIKDAELTADGENVSCLIDEDGTRLSFDLYVDCSGFRSMLLEKKLGSRFISYGSTLFNDTAIAADAPHGGHVRPYTIARTMDSGWCWTIPMLDEDHLGYVFSSAFCSPDQAYDEMKRKHPGVGEGRLVKFRSGRHEEFWKGNVVAIGNAFGFVEPLESTAIHMIIVEVKELVHWLRAGAAPSVRAACNHKINQHWDFLRGFLGIHFKFNRRLDTPYWQACRNDADISVIEENVRLFRQAAPLTAHSVKILPVPDPFQETAFGIDNLLLGQHVDAVMPRPGMSRAGWTYRSALQRELARRTIPCSDAIRLLASDDAQEIVYDASNGRRW